jgi:hypothetical protein
MHGFKTRVEFEVCHFYFIDTLGNESLLVVYQAFYLGDKHAECLVNPNKLRSYGLAVRYCCRQFDSS